MGAIYFFLGLIACAILVKIFNGVDSRDNDDINDRPMRKIRMTSSIYFDDDTSFLVGEEAFVMDGDGGDYYVTAYIDVDDWEGYHIPTNAFVYVD